MRLKLGLLAGLSAVLPAGPLLAQVPAGPVFTVNAFTTGNRNAPMVAQSRDGRLAVVWPAHGQDGDGWGVFGRVFKGTTALPGPEFQVNTYTPGDQGNGILELADVAASDSGFVVVWSSFDGAQPLGIHGQRFDWGGQRLGSEFLVSTADGLTRSARVASTAAGAFEVVWANNNSESILGQRFDAQGSRVGAEFVVGVQTLTDHPDVALDAAGGAVVVWLGSHGMEPVSVFGRRFDSGGNALGAQFAVSTEPSLGASSLPDVAVSPSGGFMVTWEAFPSGVRARVYDASGNPLTADFAVNSATAASTGRLPSVAAYGERNYVVAWHDGGPVNVPRRARTYDALGHARGPEFTVADVTNYGGPQWPLPRVATDRAGNMTAAWKRLSVDLAHWDIEARRLYGGLIPGPPAVDPVAGPSSDGNGILEPCETVAVRPGWRNDTGVSQAVSGTISGFGGPAGPTYSIVDGSADYGTLPDGGAAGCGADCYSVGLSCANPRPLTHWDATLAEAAAPFPQRANRPLHVGESFTDVPRTSPYYRFVETVLHERITAGCAGSLYCPQDALTREQMAVFLLLAREEADFVPNPCSGVSSFPDVDPASPTCPYIHGLARRGITAGCGNGNFCPSAPVTREQMAVFVLRTLDPALSPPACATPVFADVPASSPYCRWIEELARRGVVSGCGGGNYCPTAVVTREQMAVYLTVGFGLSLSAP